MRSFIRWFMRWFLLSPLLGMFMGVVLNTALPNKAVPVIALAVIMWAVWRMTAPGKRSGPSEAAQDGVKLTGTRYAHENAGLSCAGDSAADIQRASDCDAHAMTMADKEPTLDPMEAARWPAMVPATAATEAATVASNVLFIDGVPIPDDVHVSPAPQWASETQKRLLGAWAGTFDDHERHVLIVEDIRADGKARVVFSAYGEALWERDEGTVSGDKLELDFCTYKLTTSDNLLATFLFLAFRSLTFRSNARMSRIDLAALSQPGPAIDWLNGKEFFDTGLNEDGKRIRLDVVLFKPKGSGPFPLLVFNHGRIYKVAGGIRTENTDTEPEVAEFFLEKGWIIAFPQRRDRDGSTRDAQVATDDLASNLMDASRALDDIEAAIAALQRRPDVAGNRILIGGASGGGILSIAYAGLHPEKITGVINFVGGWIGDRYRRASEINKGLFARGTKYDRATLWLYGERDSVFSMAHSRSNYETFVRAGGKGEFVKLDVPIGEDGHNLSGYPDLWREHVEKYVKTLGPVDQPPI